MEGEVWIFSDEFFCFIRFFADFYGGLLFVFVRVDNKFNIVACNFESEDIIAWGISVCELHPFISGSSSCVLNNYIVVTLVPNQSVNILLMVIFPVFVYQHVFINRNIALPTTISIIVVDPEKLTFFHWQLFGNALYLKWFDFNSSIFQSFPLDIIDLGICCE